MIQHNKSAGYKWPISNPADTLFLFFYPSPCPSERRKRAGEITTRCFPALETCRHHLWLPTLHTVARKNLRRRSGRLGEKRKEKKKNGTILFWGIRLPLPPSLKTESSNWVLWGPPELPWVPCCGCLTGSVIHTHHTPLATVDKVFVAFFFFLPSEASAATDCSFASLCVYVDVCLPLMAKLCTEVMIECYITSCFLFHAAAYVFIFFFFFLFRCSSVSSAPWKLFNRIYTLTGRLDVAPWIVFWVLMRSKTCSLRMDADSIAECSPPSLLCPFSDFCACLKWN